MNESEKMEQEQGRWQDAIYALLCNHVPDNKIDGKGCDSGDPLDFTLAEIQQALAHFEDERESLRAELAKNKAAREWIDAHAQRLLSIAATYRHQDNWAIQLRARQLRALISTEEKKI